MKEIDLSNNVISSLSTLNSIKMNNLKKINISNNSFEIGTYQHIINDLKAKKIEVIIK